jgi:hypothetical protein
VDTVIAALPLQPAAFDPVTVNWVVDDGVTVTTLPDSGPGIHVYVTAPEAVSVNGAPAHDTGDPRTVTEGDGTTVMVMYAGIKQVPVAAATEYVVVTFGVTVIAVSVEEFDQVNDDAPLTVSVTDRPAHTDGDDALMATEPDDVTDTASRKFPMATLLPAQYTGVNRRRSVVFAVAV